MAKVIALFAVFNWYGEFVRCETDIALSASTE